MVNASLEAVQKAGLSPIMVDLTSFAVIRSLADADHLGMGADVEALVDVGARVTNIVVHQGGVPRFVRILLMGGQDVTDAVAERMGVPQEQAEAMKQQLALGTRRRRDGRPGRACGSSRPSGRPSSTRSAARWTTTSRRAAPRRSRASSSPVGEPASAGSPQRLQVTTRMPVQIGTPMHSLQVGRTGLSPEQIAFVEPLAAVPVGLALGVAS